MKLHICKDANDLSMQAAVWIGSVIKQTLEKQERFTLALSGGSTPQKLHGLLSSYPYKEEIDWSKIHIFWGDERAVPLDDDRNNAKMAFDTLLDKVAVPMQQIHIMRTDIDPAEAAAEYETILQKYFGATGYTLDLLLLGMGDDGHTLSLFPGTSVVSEKEKWATSMFLDSQDMYRITLTAPFANRSARVAFLTAGKAKAPALKQVLEGQYDPNHYPAQLIRPVGELHWFVDQEAAALLTQK
ncbi:MAG: 6-phosphogluconolactonase [Chitinophagaceae bacterium]|nr:MAG: 6-phosphogluconolactonase [Chitinophagaceae bacterium]